MTEAIDREKKIAEIREALEKASPGPWMFGNSVEGRRLILGSNSKYVASVQIHQTPRMYGIHDEVEREANAHLIANAPEWLGFLLDELERLEREYAETAHNTHVTELCELEKENRKLREEREKWEKEARLQYRLFNEYHDESREKIEQLRAERANLIEGLRKLAKTNAENISEIREWKEKQNDTEVTDLDWYNYVARNILKEIGVTVE